jgi:hypothetical protein
MVWIGLTWLRIGTVEGSYEHGIEAVAPQEGLRSVRTYSLFNF